jgi:hypothetical protein
MGNPSEVRQSPELTKIVKILNSPPPRFSSLTKFLIVGGSIVLAEAMLTGYEAVHAYRNTGQVPLKTFAQFLSEPLYDISGNPRTHGTYVFSYLGHNAGIATHNYLLSKK